MCNIYKSMRNIFHRVFIFIVKLLNAKFMIFWHNKVKIDNFLFQLFFKLKNEVPLSKPNKHPTFYNKWNQQQQVR
jgi:hypothetical protein